ncbi:MAG: high frequency lysogenization protein HflD [Methylovulum sp.]|nr:high frequency lysogenization protein HflD [Methylovulum sp.]
MQLNTITNQTIALAGIAQAAALVQQFASTGSTHNIALEASIGSLLKVDSSSIIDVYGSLPALKLGLEQLSLQMTGYKIANPEQARYSATIVFLEHQLEKRPDLQSIIHTGVLKAQAQSESFGLVHENIMANLGDVYSQTISTLTPRIMVNGEADLLSKPAIANKIRACLLAGIRSAMLWRQCGGKRWKFLLYRKKIQTELQHLLSQV